MNQKLTQIIEQYYNAVYCYCVSRLRSAEGAEDCTQEVFLALVRKQRQLHDLDNIRPWLYRAADLAMKEYRRKNAPYLATPDDVLARMTETVMPELGDDRLHTILTPDEYDLLTAHYLEGYTIRELAQRYGISEAAADQRMSRIRRKIAAALAKERGDAE